MAVGRSASICSRCAAVGSVANASRVGSSTRSVTCHHRPVKHRCERSGHTTAAYLPRSASSSGVLLLGAAWLAASAAPTAAAAQEMSYCVWARVTDDDRREIFNRCAGDPVTLFWCVDAPGDSCDSYTHRRNDFASGARQTIARYGTVHYGACDGPMAEVRSDGLDFECPDHSTSKGDSDAAPTGAGAEDEPPTAGGTGPSRLLTCPSTAERYPPASMRLGEQGTVEVRATVMADGRLIGAQLLASSGYPRLDAATLTLVRDCTFAPATDETGRPVDGVVQLRFGWTLEP
jgi:TonB family protein